MVLFVLSVKLYFVAYDVIEGEENIDKVVNILSSIGEMVVISLLSSVVEVFVIFRVMVTIRFPIRLRRRHSNVVYVII